MEAQARAASPAPTAGRLRAASEIRCQLGVEQVEVEVIDHGGGFDPGSSSDHPPAAPIPPASTTSAASASR